MFKKASHNHMIDFLFPIVLLFVFAVSALVVMLFAANIYSDTVNSSSRNNEARTSIAYITEKVHQNDSNGKIRSGELDGNPALILTQTIEGTDYTTYIYAADGELRELFAASDFDAHADNGSKILAVKDMKIDQLKKGLFRITCTEADGKTASTVVGCRSAKGVANDAQ